MRAITWSTWLAASTAVVLLSAQPAVGAGLVPNLGSVPAEDIMDEALIAERTGWTVVETVAHMRVQDRFGELLEHLVRVYPATFAGAVFADRPGAPSTVLFKGQVAASAAATVAAAEIPVNLRGGSRYSQQELRSRTTAVHKYLTNAGYTDVANAAMPDGSIEVTLGGGPGVMPTLPATLRDGVRISMIDGPTSRAETVRGGGQLLFNEADWCTSAFTVEHVITGVTGVATAAHCDEVDEYQDPITGGEPDLTDQFAHYGAFGDMMWFTSAESEPAEYYAFEEFTREVHSVEQYASIAVNNWYCFYGRASNDRECDNVYSTFVEGTAPGVPYVGALVAMRGDNTIGGDSGGPWSVNNEAVGIHSGDITLQALSRNVFSVAALLPVATLVQVRVQ
jgi:streptogrisin C